MFCTNCGSENKDENKFCCGCGKLLSQKNEVIKEVAVSTERVEQAVTTFEVEPKEELKKDVPIKEGLTKVEPIIEKTKKIKKPKNKKKWLIIIGVFLVLSILSGLGSDNSSVEKSSAIMEEDSEKELKGEKSVEEAVEEESDDLTDEEILTLIANAYERLTEFRWSAHWDEGEVYSPMYENLNTFEEADAFLDELWSDGSTEVFLSTSWFLAEYNNKYYVNVWDLMPLLDYKNGTILKKEEMHNRKIVTLEALWDHYDEVAYKKEVINLVKEDGVWKVEYDDAGTISEENMYITQISYDEVYGIYPEFMSIYLHHKIESTSDIENFLDDFTDSLGSDEGTDYYYFTSYEYDGFWDIYIPTENFEGLLIPGDTPLTGEGVYDLNLKNIRKTMTLVDSNGFEREVEIYKEAN